MLQIVFSAGFAISQAFRPQSWQNSQTDPIFEKKKKRRTALPVKYCYVVSLIVALQTVELSRNARTYANPRILYCRGKISLKRHATPVDLGRVEILGTSAT
jgi:hypothetical protein